MSPFNLASVRRILKGRGAVVAFVAVFLVAAMALGSFRQSSSEDSDNGRPPASATATAETTTPVADPSETADPEPSTSQPEATPSDVSLRPGQVVGAFEDGPQGPFLVLASMDEYQGDLEAMSKDKDALRNLDVTGQAISMLWKVDVSTAVFQSCRPNLTRMVFKDFPSCTGVPSATPSTTDR
ncbi:hypothetical protein BJY14_007293 [Actinomadura luteofluorescens]|uniref:Uncharacterized protein n=1 Tax=Actinomadura luteofluorescens TaxID=46163 RepID=A0A7Y9JJL6_9ACTN|nr:hypothetical protein [Actinomadura luteofluorescens]NYD51310.1 hypothetical protein [Actinomadura luteofluorescens]